MNRLKKWLLYMALGALLALGASSVPTAVGHRTTASKRAEARLDKRLKHAAAKDAKGDAADQAAETKLSGLSPAFSASEEEQTDEENENLDEQDENENEQDENEQTAEEDEQEEAEETEKDS